MDAEHDPYDSTSWRRFAMVVAVVLVMAAGMAALAFLLGLEPQF